MDHIAVMKKEWGFIPKILQGTKTIESRWYKNKSKPWDTVNIGDTIFFKNSGEPVKVKTRVNTVLQIENLNSKKTKEIVNKYGKEIGINEVEYPNYIELFKDKKYCLLIFLGKPESVAPFQINKKGFGSMSAWISVNNINLIKYN